METDLDELLDDLEDYTLNARNYETLQESLNSVEHINASTAEKLLFLCIRERIEDLKYTTHVLNIISTLLKKINDGQCSPLPNLVPSALVVLCILNTTAKCDNLDALKTMCFDTINSYPVESLVSLCIKHSGEIYKVIELYCDENLAAPAGIKFQAINFLGQVLKILPSDKKTTFLQDGIDICFSHVIPLVVKQLSTNDSSTAKKLLEILELLVDELVKFDYANFPSWQPVLQNIYTPSRYPAIMKRLLESDCTYWHRLWIVFIKLLKEQITKTANATASPINAVLPTVEMAFKMDVRNRCRAFLCWNVLIENFSKETHEAYLNKRLKLLLVPLASNNAKVEETALAKFHSWWYLITHFQEKLDKMTEAVLLPFLTFCFGKPAVNGLIPGKLSDSTKVMCTQAFINIIGHAQCIGCVSWRKLNTKLFNIQLLVKHWKFWIHCLDNAIRTCTELNSDFTETPIRCVWKTFIMTIGELPENNIRRDLLNEVLLLLEGLTQDCNNHQMEVIVNVLIPVLFDNEIQPLLKSKDDENAPIYKIIVALSKLPLDSSENRKTVLENVKLVTNWIVDEASKTSTNKIERLMKLLSTNGVLLWTALAETLNASLHSVCPRLLAEMLLWPFKYMNNFVNKEESTKAWLNLYKLKSPYLQIKTVEEDIIQALITHGNNQSSCAFVLNAATAVLENKLQRDGMIIISDLKIKSEENKVLNKTLIKCGNLETNFDTEIELILQLTSKVNTTHIKMILPSLAGVIVLILNTLNKNINVTIAENVIFIICNILKLCVSLFQDHSLNGSDSVKYIEIIFNSLESTFKLDCYSKLKSNLVDQLKDCAPYLKHDKLINNLIISIYETSLNKTNTNLAGAIAKEVVQAFKIEESDSGNAMNVKESVKKSKKEASIVNTVTENGEEFVVIKSNWKLNPRKLTDKQREKLQRRREDIPAMYQDLSQSQDDFKITTWKTDSQDASTTSSKSTNMSNEDVSSILKNISSSEFFTKAIESVSKVTTDVIQSTEPIKEGKEKGSKDKSENVKSPRMALKDRVFRNVRNLIERSNLSLESKDITENILQTPLIAKVPPTANVTHSAPSSIQDRPSRIKRKPKKFDDQEIISITKRRRSLCSNDSQGDGEIEENKVLNKMDITNDTKIIADVKSVRDGDAEIIDNLSSVCKDDALSISHIGNNKLGETIKEDVAKGKKTLCSEIILDLTKDEDSSTEIIERNKKLELISDFCNSNIIPALILDHNQQKGEEKASISENVPFTANSKRSKINVERKYSTDCKTISLSTPKLVEKCSNEGKTSVVPILLDVKQMEEVEDKSCRDIKDATVKASTDKIESIMKEHSIVDLSASEVLNRQKSTTKKKNTKKSRIESQLAIDMVEGHPFLKTQSEKRARRKSISNTPLKRKRLSFNTDSTVRKKRSTKVKDKTKDKENSVSIQNTLSSQDTCASQDVIESSQDSTITTISVKSVKPPASKKLHIVFEKSISPEDSIKTDTQNLIDVKGCRTDKENTSDIEMPCNEINLTEEIDTEPIDIAVVLRKGNKLSIPVVPEVVVLDSATHNTAEADTEPVDPDMFLKSNVTITPFEADQNTQFTDNLEPIIMDEKSEEITFHNKTSETLMTTTEDITKTLSESDLMEAQRDDSSTSCNNEQREKDFLDNTLQISPIKSMSPVHEEKSLSPETSSDYVLIKLTSPVQTNGVPFQTCESPEIFTEDKVSPDKRDNSPPREEVSIKNTSPSSSLSLKKNRPQMRSGGRAAQMLGLCVPDRQQNYIITEKPIDTEEAKRSTSLNTSARRNLRILYNSSNGESNESSDNTDDSESFLKFKRTLPTVDCSPSGPILKRKLIDIADESTASPASKRKRVSFHDPPVSTTVCVKKYIEPISIRSPQNSASKRQQRQTRAQIAVKSPRRLDNVFKLDSVLTKAVESFSEPFETQTMTEDTEISSLEETPVVEVIKTSDLNDTDPICKELADCNDHIDKIAAELSSPAMKTLFVRKLEGKVETIGDLAKMTELEINRLCIKAPKVQIAKKVLNDYLSNLKLKEANEEITPTDETATSESTLLEVKTSVEIQTDSNLTESIETQTDCAAVSLASCQTDSAIMTDCFVQTYESENKSTADIITDCLSEKPDFVEKLCEKMDDTSKEIIATNLPYDTLIKIITDKISNGDSKHVLSILQDQLVARFDCKDLILFCSSLLKNVYDNPASGF